MTFGTTDLGKKKIKTRGQELKVLKGLATDKMERPEVVKDGQNGVLLCMGASFQRLN